MRTLFISHLLPYPLNSGTIERVFHLLRALSTVSEVTFVCPTPGAEKTPEMAVLQPLYAEAFHYPSRPYGPQKRNAILHWAEWKLRYLYPLRPVEMQYATSRAGASLIRRLRPERFDLVWVERLISMQLLDKVRVPVVVDLDDLHMATLAARLRRGGPYPGMLYDFLEYLKWRRLEMGLHKLPYTFTVCSEADKRRLDGGDRVRVIPNGVEVPENCELAGERTLQPIFLFVGSMSYNANSDAVEYFAVRIWPRILKELPSAQFLIVGRDPPPSVQRLHSGTKIVVTGTVPSTVPFLKQATIMVVPIRFGSGTRIKILEAWAHRLPVVSTQLGAEGLEGEHGKHLLLADSPEDFAGACCRLARDGHLQETLASEGYALVRGRYSWEKIESIVQNLAAAVSASGAHYHSPASKQAVSDLDA
jgi:glycosyltransferase involved in cell wall biosynthesis